MASAPTIDASTINPLESAEAGESMYDQLQREIEAMTPEQREAYDTEISEIEASLSNKDSPPIDEVTRKALLDNAGWRMIQYQKKKAAMDKQSTAKSTVRLMSSHGFDGSHDVLTVDLGRCLRAAMGINASDPLPSRHCYIQNIDLVHANNTFKKMDVGLKVQGDKLRGSCICGVSLENEGSENLQENHLVVVPSNSTLPSMESVYTSRGFEETDTFLKYGDALKYNIRGAVHTEIPTSASVDYISPFTLGPEELQSIHTEDFSSILAERQSNPAWKTHGDYFLHLLAKNYKTFEKPAAFMTRPSIVKGSDDIWALTYAKSDCEQLCKSIDTKIMAELKSHIIDLENPAERALKFQFMSAHVDEDGMPVKAEGGARDNHVGVVLKVTAAFV